MVKKALLIGINYDESDNRLLEGPRNDIALAKEILMKNYDFKEEDITIMHEKQNNSELKPTRKNLIREMEAFFSSGKKDDILLFHYSGHASRIKTKECNPTGVDCVFLPMDIIISSFENHIPDFEFKKLIKIQEGCKLYLVLDCCFSGVGKGEIEDNNNRDSNNKSRYVEPPKELSPDEDKNVNTNINFYNVFASPPFPPSSHQKCFGLSPEEQYYYSGTFLAACKENQKANSIKMDSKYYGIFSYYLYSNATGRGTNEDIISEVTNKIKEKSNFLQTPELKPDQNKKNLFLH